MDIKEHEKWWDKNVVTEKSTTMDSFRKVLDRNGSRALYLDIIKKFKPKSVLDVGCGLGLDYELYKANNIDIEYHGIDVCKGFIEENKKNFPEADWQWAKSYDMPFKKDSIDLVTCRGVLEHLETPYKTMQEMKRISSQYIAIIWFLIPQLKEEIKKTKSGFFRNIYSIEKIETFLHKYSLKILYKDEVKDNKSPMKRHEIWVIKK
jgi:ubiquinone/menaquinone biosynthesis C-methylase UbiE